MMHYCQFRAGEIVIGVSTPEPLDIREPYSAFVTAGEKESISVKFDYTEKIDICGSPITETDTAVITEDDECINFYYHVPGESSIYAYRKMKRCDTTAHEIFIPEKYRGKIWTRLVFNLINIEDVASQFSAVIFHSSYICRDGKAILFTAPCGTGKSTQAALWEKHRGAEIINGDKSMLYIKDDAAVVSGLPFSGSSDICKNKKMPVKAIVRLSQAKENSVERLTGMKAFKAVFEGCYHSKWNADYNKSTMATVDAVISSVPVISLACLPDESAVAALENFIDAL